MSQIILKGSLYFTAILFFIAFLFFIALHFPAFCSSFSILRLIAVLKDSERYL